MTAVRKILIEQEPMVAVTVARAPAAKLYVVSNNAAPVKAAAPATAGSAVKNIALFLVSPFIGLAYIVALPFVGLAVMALLLARVAAKYQAVRAVALALKTAGMAVAAPVVGLAFIVFFPVVGLGALAWMGGRAAVGAGASNLR
jgi:hypothetical protein